MVKATSIDRSPLVSVWVSLAGRSVKVWLVSITSKVQIGEGNLLASQRRVGPPRTYPCPTPWRKGTHKPWAGGLLAARRSAAHREVCLISIQIRGCNYHTSFALGTVQVQESGGREACRATLMPHILRTNIVAMRDKSYTTPHPCLLPLEENGWMLAWDEYVPVPCLYKPTSVVVLELIKCDCKTSCKGHCSCMNNIPCTALCKCHNSDCSNLPDYRMIADEEEADIWLLQEDENEWTIRRLRTTDLTH